MDKTKVLDNLKDAQKLLLESMKELYKTDEADAIEIQKICFELIKVSDKIIIKS